MKLIFNDATEITVQQVKEIGCGLQILVANAMPEHLRVLFTDELKTSYMRVEERGQTLGEYEGYTEFYRTEEYTGKLYGVVVNQVGRSTEERLAEVEDDVETAKKEIEEIKESGGVIPENYSAVSSVAKMQAQTLTDKQALAVKSIYDTWYELVKAGFTAEEAEYKFTHEDVLYKTVKAGQEFQAQWVPGEGTESIFTRIDEAHAGTIEDPIPAVANMEYEYGKYYIENDVIYICKRGGITDEEAEKMYGQKVTLQYLPSQLIGQYFKAVE